MRSALLFYLAGIAIALLIPAPPSALVVLSLAALAFVVLLFRPLRFCAAVICGALWGSLHTSHYLELRPTLPAAGQLEQVSGVVASFPRTHGQHGSFAFEVAGSNDDWWPPAPAARIRVNGDTRALAPKLGAWCVLYVRLRRAHALANPGARDLERGYAAQRLTAFATIVRHPANQCTTIAPRYDLRRVRSELSKQIDAAVFDPRAAAIIKALAVADRSAIDTAQWQRMRDTGTSHLLAISGLHVSLCAAWAFVICRALGACLCCRWQAYPAIRLAWIGALVAALVYAGLAGFGIPARRAACMVAGATVAALSGRRVLSLDNLLLALALLATADPLSLLADGLWLSFGAVAILIMVAQVGAHANAWLRQAWRTHCLLALGLAPISALLVDQLALISPLANLLAVPWCSALIVPLTLAGTLLSGLSDVGAAVAWETAARLWLFLDSVLEALAELDLEISTRAHINGVTAVLLAAALALLALPRAVPVRLLAAILLSGVVLVREREIEHETFTLTVLDVGQGLAVIVRTRSHVLLYDTGPAWWGQDRDAGSAVVIPALERARVTHLDVLALSHGDNDHAGGLQSVLSVFDPGTLYAPPASRLERPFKPCQASRGWLWDGVEFEWLHPHQQARGSRNDLSCVLHIKSAWGNALLSGDIERGAENEILQRSSGKLAAEVLIVPHHGSRTSSSAAFVAAVRPRYALVAAGYGNRYGLPHQEIVEAYRAHATQVLNTATDGALNVAITRAGTDISSERQKRLGFWTRAGITRQ